jgi:hypothetical protein
MEVNRSQLSTAILYPDAKTSSSTSGTIFSEQSGPWLRSIKLANDKIDTYVTQQLKYFEGVNDLAHFYLPNNESDKSQLFSFWIGKRNIYLSEQFDINSMMAKGVELPLFVPIGAGAPNKFFQVAWMESRSDSSLLPAIIFNSNLMTDPGMRVFTVDHMNKTILAPMSFTNEFDGECRYLNITTAKENKGSSIQYFCERSGKWFIESDYLLK